MANGLQQRLLAQGLMRENRDNPFSDSRFFSGKIRPPAEDLSEDITREQIFKGASIPYAVGATGAMFTPGSGFSDVLGFAPDPMNPGQTLPSLAENVRQGNLLDAGLQTLGAGGDVMLAAAPFAPVLVAPAAAMKGASQLGKALKSGSKGTDKSNRFLHGTLIDNISNIKKLGLIPGVGKNTKESYSEYSDLLKDALYVSRPEDAERALSAIKNQIGIKLKKQASEVTDQDIVNNGALVVTRSNKDTAIYEAGEGGETFTLSGEKGYFDTNVSDEAGDIVSKDILPATGILKGKALKNFFEKQGLLFSKPGDIAKVEPPTDTQPGIIAFHGSGADFDQFRMDKIDTGEGAQVFGYGLYFTDTEDIAKFYKNKISEDRFETPDGRLFDPYEPQGDGTLRIKNPNIRTSILDHDGNIEKSINRAEGIIQNNPNTEASMLAEQDLITLRNIQEKGGLKKLEGKTYKVNIKTVTDNLINHDIPINEQSKNMQDKVQEIIEIMPFAENRFFKLDLSLSGGLFRQELESQVEAGINKIADNNVKRLKKEISQLDFEKMINEDPFLKLVNSKMLDDKTVTGYIGNPLGSTPKIASEIMNEFGIKGIKYLDNASRNTFGGELLGINKLDDGQFQARIVLDDPNRQTGLGGSGRVITTSKPYKTQKEAEDWANTEIGNRSSNYVIFDENLINILAKYGIVGPVAVTGLAKSASIFKDDENN